jgi:hypothetical protein
MDTHTIHMVLYPKTAPESIEAVRVPAPRVVAALRYPGPPSFR